MYKKSGRRGFTLIELLIVVAIIGIISAIAIPNLLGAIQRAKQKRSMGDLRSLGLALQEYAVDYMGYPNVSAGNFSPVAALLAGEPFPSPPERDAWRNTFYWLPNDQGSNGLYGTYQLWSFGLRGMQELPLPAGAATHYFECDIIYERSSFRQKPEGIQKT